MYPHFFLSVSQYSTADPPEGNALPTPGTTATASSPNKATLTTPSTSTSAATGAASSAVAAAGGATALFPCLVYYPGSQNYSLIWVPMDGSNPIVSGANILSGSGAITIPTQVTYFSCLFLWWCLICLACMGGCVILCASF